MTSFPNSPRTLASGIVTVEPRTAKVLSVVALHYNPDSLTRKLQVQRFGGENPEHGMQLQIAALEALVNPTSRHLCDKRALASSGALEIAPAEMPLALFVWSAERVVPVRVTEFTVRKRPSTSSSTRSAPRSNSA